MPTSTERPSERAGEAGAPKEETPPSDEAEGPPSTQDEGAGEDEEGAERGEGPSNSAGREADSDGGLPTWASVLIALAGASMIAGIAGVFFVRRYGCCKSAMKKTTGRGDGDIPATRVESPRETAVMAPEDIPAEHNSPPALERGTVW